MAENVPCLWHYTYIYDLLRGWAVNKRNRKMVEPASGVRGRSVSVTPLIGAGTHGGGPRSCLLKLGSVRILVDCGCVFRSLN